MLNKILITSIGGGLATELVNQIKKTTTFKKIYITGVDMTEQTPSKFFVDKFYKVPPPNKKDYVSKMIKIIKKDKINLIIPGSDQEAINLCKNRSLFESKKCILASVDLKTLSNFTDKESTYNSLKKNNLPCAEFYTVKNKSDLLKIIKKFGKKEFVIKPSVSIGGRDISVFRNDISTPYFFNQKKEIHYPNKRKNLLKIKKKYEGLYPLVISERLFAPTYDIDMLSFKGKTINVVARKRLNPQVPNDGHEVIKQKKIQNIGKKIIKNYNLSWLYDCDCMTDEKGKIKIIEINPRMSGSLATSIIAGYPIIDNLLRLINKYKLDFREPRKNILVMPFKTLHKVE
jgi:carbamoyl-phosphate synthase large subunit